MGKASNQEDGVIACPWASPPARQRPVHLVEWQREGAVAWRKPVMAKWLAEASFLLRLLMAPSSRPKRIREASPEFRTAPARGGCHDPTLSPAGLAEPPALHASLTPWPGSSTAPRSTLRARARPQRAGCRHHGSGMFSAELAGGGSPERGRGQPVSGAETRASSEMAEGGAGAWAVGSNRPSAREGCRQVSENRDTPIRTRMNPRPFWEKARQKVGNF